MARVYRRATLATLLILLSGCSSTTFLYNRLDFIVPWYVQKYVDLDRVQTQSLKEMLQPFLAWHRTRELPAYLALLDDVEALLKTEVSSEALRTILLDAEAAWLRTEDKGLDWLIGLGEQLSSEQINEFITELRDKQKEYEEEYLDRSEEEYREDAYDNLMDSTQDYLGRLDALQREVYRDAAEQLLRSDAIWLRERAVWLDRLENILRREPGWQQVLRDSLVNREQSRSAEYRETYEHNLQVVLNAVAAVLNSRDQKQDRRLHGKVNDLREDLQALIAKD